VQEIDLYQMKNLRKECETDIHFDKRFEMVPSWTEIIIYKRKISFLDLLGNFSRNFQTIMNRRKTIQKNQDFLMLVLNY